MWAHLGQRAQIVLVFVKARPSNVSHPVMPRNVARCPSRFADLHVPLASVVCCCGTIGGRHCLSCVLLLPKALWNSRLVFTEVFWEFQEIQRPSWRAPACPYCLQGSIMQKVGQFDLPSIDSSESRETSGVPLAPQWRRARNTTIVAATGVVARR